MQGFTIWLTGLSGAGKSTLARQLQQSLQSDGRSVEVLDGDVVRLHLAQGLGFSRGDRDINIHRIAYVASLLVRHGVIVVVAAISPYAAARAQARQLLERFVEVHVSCPLQTLIDRDPKGLYQKALQGDIPHFTGISDPYEAPTQADITIDTSRQSIDQGVSMILHHLHHGGLL